MLKADPPRIDEIGRYILRENAHNPERKIGARRITVPAIKVAGIYYRHGSGGASLKDAASGILMLRQHGMETQRPAGRAETARLARCEA